LSSNIGQGVKHEYVVPMHSLRYTKVMVKQSVKKTTKTSDFQPSKMTLAVAAAAAVILVVVAIIAVMM